VEVEGPGAMMMILQVRLGRVVAEQFLRPVVQVEELIEEGKLNTAEPVRSAIVVELGRLLQVPLEHELCMKKVGTEQGASVGEG